VPDPRAVLPAAELRRLRGSKWASTDGNTPVTLTACASPVSTIQQWKWNVSGTGDNYVQNAATSLCINVDDCGAPLIAFTCVNTGSTCANDFDGLRFVLGADKTLRTPSEPGMCATSAGAGMQVELAACAPGSAAQQWSLSAAGQLQSGGLCLTVGDGAAARTAVIGRPLADGAWAVAFFNAGLAPGDVVCDAACVAGMGFDPTTQVFAVRDLLAHAGLPDSPAGANITAPGLLADGGVALLKVMPIFTATIPTTGA
jgi:hypothetical protein